MRPLLLTVLLLTAATSLSAQLRPKISLSAGGNASNTHWFNQYQFLGQTMPSNEANLAIAGFQAGLSFELPVSSTFGVLVAPTFSRRGFRGNEDLYGVNSSVRLDYFDLPALIRFYPVNNFYVEAGAAVSFMLKAESVVDGEPIGNEDVMGRLYNDTDLSAVLGLGYAFNDRLSVNVRLFHGLLTTLDTEFADPNGEPLSPEDQPKLLNQSLQLSVQYAILNP
jgi:hypothetical protein